MSWVAATHRFFKAKHTEYKSIYVKCVEQANSYRWKEDQQLPSWGYEWGLTANEHERSFLGVGNTLQLNYDDDWTTL